MNIEYKIRRLEGKTDTERERTIYFANQMLDNPKDAHAYLKFDHHLTRLNKYWEMLRLRNKQLRDSYPLLVADGIEAKLPVSFARAERQPYKRGGVFR
jgi:hypothetical protein